MLQKVDQHRLDKVLARLKEYELRFEVAEVVRRTGKNKGNVSKYLNGVLPMSEDFYNIFMEKFPPKDDKITIANPDILDELRVITETNINQQAAINLLLKASGQISKEQIKKESRRLFGVYKKKKK